MAYAQEMTVLVPEGVSHKADDVSHEASATATAPSEGSTDRLPELSSVVLNEEAPADRAGAADRDIVDELKSEFAGLPELSSALTLHKFLRRHTTRAKVAIRQFYDTPSFVDKEAYIREARQAVKEGDPRKLEVELLRDLGTQTAAIPPDKLYRHCLAISDVRDSLAALLQVHGTQDEEKVAERMRRPAQGAAPTGTQICAAPERAAQPNINTGMR